MSASREQAGGARPTRLIALGEAALMEGFSLIGLETYPNATAETLETLLAELVRGEQKALLFLEHGLARSGGPWLKRVREEGGHIVITEIPPLNAPGSYEPEVDRLVRAILGPNALERSK